MFGVKNFYYVSLMVEDGILKLLVELKVFFVNVGVDMIWFVIIICGLGVIVVVFILVMMVVGVRELVFYDGFWFEWGSCEDMDVVIGLV